MKTLLQTAALLAATCVAAAAAADPLEPDAGAPGRHGPVKVLVIVSAQGLNLSSEAGANLFLRRLDSAVSRACNDRPESGAYALGRTEAFQACRAKALETAMTYVHAPNARQRYAAMRGREELRLARR
ncbi:UrcA family protein [Phenylobacterium sp.]|uniref:UrcA family protein n=1 Tax=Phenylobacterium sp. TaxID=1871053 RepID=UPI00286B7EE6|nr:UrcA family protein [Phenylobacterium sp.]